MEVVNLNLNFEKLFKIWKSYEGIKFGQLKEEDLKFLTLLCVKNLVHLVDSECLLCVHNAVCV